MSAFRPHEIRVEASDGPSRALLLSDTGGLSQFGAVFGTRPPGARSPIRHWHAKEDGLVHILAGAVDLHEGDRAIALGPGDIATFRAGDPVGHCPAITSGAEARYPVIATRAARDRIT